MEESGNKPDQNNVTVIRPIGKMTAQNCSTDSRPAMSTWTPEVKPDEPENYKNKSKNESSVVKETPTANTIAGNTMNDTVTSEVTAAIASTPEESESPS